MYTYKIRIRRRTLEALGLIKSVCESNTLNSHNMFIRLICAKHNELNITLKCLQRNAKNVKSFRKHIYWKIKMCNTNYWSCWKTYIRLPGKLSTNDALYRAALDIECLKTRLSIETSKLYHFSALFSVSDKSNDYELI